jgi:hypothetical protein
MMEEMLTMRAGAIGDHMALVDPAEIERPEVEAVRSCLADSSCKILALAARDRDHVVVVGCGKPARNRKPDATAAASDEDITHRGEPVCPLP